MRSTPFLLLLFLCFNTCVLDAQLVPYRKGDTWQVYNTRTKTSIGQTYEDVVPATCGLLFTRIKGLWGAIDQQQKKIVPAVYAELRQLNRTVLFARDVKGIHLLDTLGKPITATLFTEAQPFRNDPALIVVCDANRKYGIIDSKGKIILDLDYDFAPEHLDHGYLVIGKKTKLGEKQVGLLDTFFKPVLPVLYDKISLLEDRYFVCHAGESYVLYDFNRKEIYRGAGRPCRTYTNFILLCGENQIGVYSKKAEKTWIFHGGFYYYVWDAQGMCAFNNHEDNVVYFVTADGDSSTITGYDVAIQQAYTPFFPATLPSENRTNKYGMSDRFGKLVVPMQYDIISGWNQKYFVAQTYSTDEKGHRVTTYELMDIVTGKPAMPRTYEGVELFPMGGIALKENGYYRLYDSNLKLQDNREYEQVRMGDRLFPNESERELYQVRVKGNRNTPCIGYMDGACRMIIPPIYKSVAMIKDGYNTPFSFCRLAAVLYDSAFSRYGRCVLLGCDGKEIGNARVRGIGYAANNALLVYNDVKYEDEIRTMVGLMDSMGNIIVPTAYDQITPVRGRPGFQFTRNGRSGYADAHGHLLSILEFSNLWAFADDLIVANKSGRTCIFDAYWNPVMECNTVELKGGPYLNGKLFRVQRDRKEFYVDRNGTEYYEP